MKASVDTTSRRRFLQGIGGTLGVLGLAACGTVVTTPAPEEKEAMAPKEEQKAPEPAELTEVDFFIGPFAGRNAETFDTLLENFHEKHPEIQINLIVAGAGNYQENIRIFVAAGAASDVVHMSGPHLTYAVDGNLVNLDDYAKADNSFDIDVYYPRVTDYYRVPEGGLWCLPWNYATEGLYYNKQHFAEAGVEEPDENWNWDDVAEAARKLTKDANNDGEPEAWGVEFRLARLDHVLRSYGGGFLVEENTKSVVTDPGSITALQYLADLILKDRVHPYPTLGWRNGISQGVVSMSFLPEWAAVRLAAVEGLDFEIGLIPQGPEGRVTFFIPGGAGIFSNTDAPDAAWEVLKWYTNSDGGEWALARAIAFVAGSPTAHREANEYFWNTHLQKPANRQVFLQNPDFAVVPYSHSWDGVSFNGIARELLPKIWEGTTSVEEVTRELDKLWNARLDETGRG